MFSAIAGGHVLIFATNCGAARVDDIRQQRSQRDTFSMSPSASGSVSIFNSQGDEIASDRLNVELRSHFSFMRFARGE
jgi:hypothetical protein